MEEELITMDYDCGFSNDNKWFRYRAAAIIVEEGFLVKQGMNYLVDYLADGGEEQIRDNESGHPVVSVESLGGNWYYVVTDY